MTTRLTKRAVVPSVEKLIAEINAGMGRLRVDSLKLGALLKALKSHYPRQFAVVVRERLDMDRTTAFRFMAIHDRLGSVATSQQLPAYPSTLYELSKLPADRLEELVASGKIGPKTSVGEARQLAVDAGWGRRRTSPTVVEEPQPPLTIAMNLPSSLQVLLSELGHLASEFREYMLEEGDPGEERDLALTLYDVLEPLGFDTDQAVGNLLECINHERRLAHLIEHIRVRAEKCPPDFWPRIAHELRNAAKIIDVWGP